MDVRSRIRLERALFEEVVALATHAEEYLSLLEEAENAGVAIPRFIDRVAIEFLSADALAEIAEYGVRIYRLGHGMPVGGVVAIEVEPFAADPELSNTIQED